MTKIYIAKWESKSQAVTPAKIRHKNSIINVKKSIKIFQMYKSYNNYKTLQSILIYLVIKNKILPGKEKPLKDWINFKSNIIVNN